MAENFEKTKTQPSTMNSPMNIVKLSVLAGLTIEGVAWVYRTENYKNIFRFCKSYPGFTMCGIGSLIGVSMSWGGELNKAAELAKGIWTRRFND